MKKTTLLLILVSASQSFAQHANNPKTKDLGISISNFSLTSIPFTGVYKSGRDNKFWRYELGNIGAAYTLPSNKLDSFSNYYAVNNNFSFNLGIAREKRKEITNHFTFYSGLMFGFSAFYSEQLHFDYTTSFGTGNKNATDKTLMKSLSISPGIGYSIGAIFSISNHLYLSGQLSSLLSYDLNYKLSRSKDLSTGMNNYSTESITHRPNFYANLSYVKVGLFYTFTK